MQDPRDDYEPIIATRRSREPLRDETRPLWQVLLALSAGLAIAVSLAWWWMQRSANDVVPAPAQSEDPLPEVHVEQEIAPPARDLEPDTEMAPVPQVLVPAAEPEPEPEPEAGAEQAVIPQSVPEVVPDDEASVPSPPPVSVRFMSPDAQVRVELHGSTDATVVRGQVGDVLALPAGTYKAVVSGAQLETFEQAVTVDGGRQLEYTVELCAQRPQQHESLAGRIVEERTCSGATQCESVFTILSEYAEQLVKDRAFRSQECASWRANAAPSGSWTLNTNCDGATPVTTCRIDIAVGACTFAEPPRSARRTACPRAELR